MSLTTPWYLLLWERPAEDQGKQYRSMGTVYTYSDAKRWPRRMTPTESVR